MKIIAKKIRQFIGHRNGLIKPLFRIDDNQNITPISLDEYPNSGHIFFSDYELLDNDIKDEMFLMDNCFFISDDNNYEDKQTESGACKKRINYNARISSFFKNVEPTKFIPIYTNSFSIQNNEVEFPENIKSKIFFLKNKTTLFGPFERNGKELKATNFKDFEENFNDELFLNFIEDYERRYDFSTIFEIALEKASNFIFSDNENFEYLEDFKLFIDNQIGNPIDFTPIASLHKWALDKLTQSSPSISPFVKEIKNISSVVTSSSEKLKWKKYIDYIETIENEEVEIENLVKLLFNKKFISETIDTSEIEKLNKKIENIENELKVKDNANLTLIEGNRILKEERDELKEELKEEKRNTSKTVDSLKFPKLSEALNSEEKIIETENILKENITYTILNNENNILEGEKRVLERDIKKKEEELRGIKDSVKKIKDAFDRSASEHTAKLQEAKMYTDLLNGIEILPNKSKNEDSEKTKANVIPLGQDFNAENYILEIKERLTNQGRDISFNDVANLAITINQTFITIIAGVPGVGKTSLVEKLSKSYGLNEDFGYLEIACAKGWTSSKDLIGFFNPLTNKFQPAKTKLREALKKSEDNPNAPYIVLLDEANLSPIEHYWSDFIKLADTNYSRKIKISDTEEIQFGDGFRFVATINHDHTTEALSNRLIDRAAIIQLDKTKEIKDNKTINIDTIFDFTELQNLFIETQKWKTEEALIRDTFNKIKERLESNHTIIISPRKEIAVYKYCKVATGLLKGNSYVALDYAIAQHILPSINGRGESFQKLLEGLKSDLNDKGMSKSEKLLTKIIERGKELKHFRYIYY
nr:AAA family ATPase [uncultured Flavobacterium sp.]